MNCRLALTPFSGCPTLLKVRGGIGHTEGDLEGRVTTAEYDVVFVVNVYTPNSGAGLKRLAFRTGDWDEAFAAYVKGLEKIKPVVVVGEVHCGLPARTVSVLYDGIGHSGGLGRGFCYHSREGIVDSGVPRHE